MDFGATKLMSVLSMMIIRSAVILARGDKESVDTILAATKKMLDANAAQEIESYREVKGINRPYSEEFNKSFN